MTTEERLRRIEAELEELRPLKIFLAKAKAATERAAADRNLMAAVAALTALPPKSHEQLKLEADLPRLEQQWEQARDRAFKGRAFDSLTVGDPGYAELVDAEQALARAKGRITDFDRARQFAASQGNHTSPIRKVLQRMAPNLFQHEPIRR